ncbi:hypothetical protein ACJ73_01233 [Blastomyces percursus]|uniref:N-acetyltransferase domain-containing protein n=1 Tax=Blastomyces percursus TaxID=1658174 RepID=A0A1J9QFU2_9EURO|nr:hypothetical protein ACJ73_01233 [Blastomyces percursus]
MSRNNGDNTAMDIFTTKRLRMERLDEKHLQEYHNIWSNPLAAKWSPRGVSKTLEDSRQYMSGVLRQNNPRGETFAVHLLPSSEPLKPLRDPVSPSALVADKISRTTAIPAAAVTTTAITDGQLSEPGDCSIDPSENETTENPSMTMIGVVGTHRSDPVAELGYIFHPSAWGKGYATEAVSAFVDIFWGEQMAANEIEAQVDPDNLASTNVLRKCGFALVAEANEDGERLLIFRIFRPGLYD